MEETKSSDETLAAIRELRDMVLERDERIAGMQEQLHRMEARLIDLQTRGPAATTRPGDEVFPATRAPARVDGDVRERRREEARDAEVRAERQRETERERAEVEAAERARRAEQERQAALERAAAARAEAERLAREKEEKERQERLRREAEERRKAEEAQRKRDELDRNRHKRLEELLDDSASAGESSLFGNADKKRDTTSLFD
mmetsp:Transcript_715/g.1897  ORF Transcript_715/g.1897 Transcript_715/m.1897 type:complete len:204 (+) Transcript_715:20-631(+)